ncbi:MAG: LolA family protein [Planctomycetota bacterium]
MKSNMTKLATAAVIIVAVVLTLTILDRTVTPAWAIEDTVKALDQFNGIYLSGVVGVPIETIGHGEDLVLRGGENMSVEYWMQANEERTRSENYRIEAGDGTIWSVHNRMTYRYDPASNTVRVQSGRGIEMSIWPSGDYLSKLEEFMEDWQVMYGKDAVTGRDCAFITLSNPSQGQSWWLEIDLETNLPVRAKGWHNTRREGTPSMNFQKIVFYEELADDIFEFQIPEGATVIEE